MVVSEKGQKIDILPRASLSVQLSEHESNLADFFKPKVWPKSLWSIGRIQDTNADK